MIQHRGLQHLTPLSWTQSCLPRRKKGVGKSRDTLAERKEASLESGGAEVGSSKLCPAGFMGRGEERKLSVKTEGESEGSTLGEVKRQA